MKKLFALLMSLSLILALTACGESQTDETASNGDNSTQSEPVELYVFAAASMEESLDR